MPAGTADKTVAEFGIILVLSAVNKNLSRYGVLYPELISNLSILSHHFPAPGRPRKHRADPSFCLNRVIK